MSMRRADARRTCRELPGIRSSCGPWPTESALTAAPIEDCDPALAAAEFLNQINEIVRAGRDIAGAVRLHRHHRPPWSAGVMSERASCRQFQRRHSTWAASA